MPFRQSPFIRCHSGKRPGLSFQRCSRRVPPKASVCFPVPMAELTKQDDRKPLPLTHRPALSAAALFITGILLHRLLPDRSAIWLIASAALLIAALGTLRYSAISTTCLAVA